MNQSQVDTCTGRLISLFPERKTTDAEILLFESMIRSHHEDVALAAIDSYKLKCRAKTPNLSAFKAVLLVVAENNRLALAGDRADRTPADFWRVRMKRDSSVSDLIVLYDAHNEMIQRAAEMYGFGSPNVSLAIKLGRAELIASGLGEHVDSAEGRWRGQP